MWEFLTTCVKVSFKVFVILFITAVILGVAMTVTGNLPILHM